MISANATVLSGSIVWCKAILACFGVLHIGDLSASLDLLLERGLAGLLSRCHYCVLRGIRIKTPNLIQ